MVELRKRPPPKEPATPAPAPKKRTSKPKVEASDDKGSNITAKAKQAVTKVKESVGASTDASTSNKDKQPTVEDEAQVEHSTAPNTTTSTGNSGNVTIPAKPTEPPASKALEHPPEKGKVEAVTGPSAGGESKGPLNAESVGKRIHLAGFGGDVETHDGRTVNVQKLLGENSTGGIVIFTYPRASTPGCTQQACLFRDAFSSLSSPPANLKVYGLSSDSPKSNTTFVTKQSLNYPLLCDPKGTLISAIGMKKPGGTSRGVVIIDKDGVVKVWLQAGPAKTVDAVKEYVQGLGK